MTTPDPYGNFTSDYGNLIADAQGFSDQEGVRSQATTDYNDQYAYLNELAMKHERSPDELMLMFIALFCNQGFNQLDSGLESNGDALKIQGDITACGNDIEQDTNDIKDKIDPNNPDNGTVAWVARDTDQLLDVLDTSKTSGTNWFINEAIGSDAEGSLYSQDLIVRQDIYWANDNDQNKATYNPQPIDPDQQVPPWSYHFDVDNSNPGTTNSYMRDYYTLNQNMQASGDPSQATEAAKLKTDAFNQNTSTTQSTGSASQSVITQDSNTEKSLDSFVSDIMHSVISVINAANQAGAKASS